MSIEGGRDWYLYVAHTVKVFAWLFRIAGQGGWKLGWHHLRKIASLRRQLLPIS